MELKEVMAELESFGNEGIKKILLKHGVKEPFFGVKVEHLKMIQKKVKMDYALSLALFNTKNADAMYLAGLIADDPKMTSQDLQHWAALAVSNNISEYTVPWVAAGSNHGFELAMQWIDSDAEHIAASGWATLSGLAAMKPDSQLDLEVFKHLLKRIESDIHSAKTREKYTMNGFIIATGTYIQTLTEAALAVAAAIGTVSVDMNGTACKIPDATTYIKKAIDKGIIGKKKKILKC